MEMRLDKMLSHYGIGTRKEVKKYIKKGFVKVNSKIVKNDDMKINLTCDIVEYDGQVVIYRPYVYIMLNKPSGYVSATKDNVHLTVVDLVKGYDNYHLFPVGRLDIDTEGLVILTNDGDFAHRLLSPNRHHCKLYYAIIDGIVNENDVLRFQEGIMIDNYRCFPAQLKIISCHDDKSEVYIEIYEGKFHQIKRMVQALDKKVLYLKRVQIKSLKLDDCLSLGQYRELTDNELFDLKHDL